MRSGGAAIKSKDPLRDRGAGIKMARLHGGFGPMGGFDGDRRGGSRRRQKRESYHCCCCGGTFRFCWSCPCGFAICQDCMLENLWGMTCNNVTWICPDCGEIRPFGNQ